MYTAEEKELILDKVDKMSLSQDFTGAFEYIKNEVYVPFDPTEEEEFKANLKQLVKINALKFGIQYEGVFN